MNTVNEQEITRLVEGFHGKGANWHYHLLTPNCSFNKSKQYAILVENIDTQELFVLYSDRAKMELSNSFSNMLHGKDVVNAENIDSGYSPSKEVAAILNLTKELSEENIKWHHHVFFPGCTFNSHADKFELVVEDPRNHHVLVSVSDTEPKEDLKQIESAFYAQDM